MSEFNYSDEMDAGVANLVENASVNKVTNHAEFNVEKLNLGKDVTVDEVIKAAEIINKLSSQVDVAVAKIARDAYAENDQLTTFDGTLNMGTVQINSQHHLKQQVGEQFLYGVSTTTTDFIHSEESANWLNTQRDANMEQAAKLFG